MDVMWWHFKAKTNKIDMSWDVYTYKVGSALISFRSMFSEQITIKNVVNRSNKVAHFSNPCVCILAET